MTDAFECDRCGELYGQPPDMKVATNSLQSAAGSVALKRKERSIGAADVITPKTSNATYEINQGDLCEDCAEAFREFWGGGDS